MYLGGLCFITDRNASNLTPCEMALFALQAGVRWVQYREKEKNRLEVYRAAKRLRKLTRLFGARLIVNDHVDIALLVGADGVHLGQEDLPLREARKLVGRKMIVGISTHGIEEAVKAERGGADYIGFGPVFKTTTKEAAGSPKGVLMLKEIKSTVGIPVVAIGGISADNLSEVVLSGADAVASATALLKGDTEKTCRSFLKELGKQRRRYEKAASKREAVKI